MEMEDALGLFRYAGWNRDLVWTSAMMSFDIGRESIAVGRILVFLCHRASWRISIPLSAMRFVVFFLRSVPSSVLNRRLPYSTHIETK